MTPRQLSDQLKAFGIKPVSLKFQGDVVQRGYRLDQFEDTFTRYLTPLSTPGNPEEDQVPTIPNQSRYAATSAEPCGSTGSGLVAAEVTDPQLFGDGASEGAPEAATRNLSATPKTASGLASSGVAAGMGGNGATAAESFFEGEIE